MNSLLKSEYNFNAIPTETLEELLVYRSCFNFVWNNLGSIHFVALIVDQDNILEVCQDTLDDYLSSSFGLDRGVTNRIETIDAYAKAKKRAMLALEEVHVWAKHKDMSSTKHGKNYIKRYGGNAVTLHMLIGIRRTVQAVERIPLQKDVKNLSGQLKKLKEELDFSTIVVNLGRMSDELKSYIHGYIDVPILNEDGSERLNEMGMPQFKRVITEPNPNAIEDYRKTVDTLRELIANGANKSQITSTDYKTSEMKLIEEILEQQKSMKKRGVTFKSANR